MTVVYFVRHAESDHKIIDELTRPLTTKGKKDADELVNHFDKMSIDSIYSSPYLRAVSTIRPIANKKGIAISIRDNFKERSSNSSWIHNQMDLETFVGRMWIDVNRSVDGGETIAELKKRNINELALVLNKCKNKTIIIGTHGTALASIISNYEVNFSGKDFMKFINIMPYIVRMKFNEQELIEIDRE